MKKELTLLGISRNNSDNTTAVILAQTDGVYKLPIIINTIDAVTLGHIQETGDVSSYRNSKLIYNLIELSNYDVQTIQIINFRDGIFDVYIELSDGLDTQMINCDVADGLIIANMYDCDIMIDEELLYDLGIIIHEEHLGFEQSENLDFDSLMSDQHNNESKLPFDTFGQWDDDFSNNDVSIIHAFMTDMLASLEEDLSIALTEEDYTKCAKLQAKIDEFKELLKNE